MAAREPPPPGNFEIRYSEVNSGGFWGCLLYLIKECQNWFVGLYFSMCTGQQNMCALRL